MEIENLKKIIKENEVVVIKFYTNDCGVCKQYEKEFEKAKQEFKQFKFISLDLNEKTENIDFASSYSVFGVPTTLIIKNNNSGELIQGFKSFTQLSNLLKNYN